MFVNRVYVQLKHEYEATCHNVAGKNLNIFLPACHMISALAWTMLFGNVATETEKMVSVELVWLIKSLLLKNLAKVVVERTTSPVASATHEHPQEATGPGRGNLRYLAGRWIVKAKNAAKKHVERYLVKNWAHFKESMLLIHLLESLEISQAQILQIFSDLATIQRRQNISCGLITDTAFQLFMDLDLQRRQINTIEQFHVKGSSILEFQTDILLAHTALQEQWTTLFNDLPQQFTAQNISVGYTEIVKRFLMVSNHQFRKTILSYLRKKKKESLPHWDCDSS